VDIRNSFEARRKLRAHFCFALSASPPWLRSSRHIKNGLVAEERHYVHQVVAVKRIEERLEGVLRDNQLRVKNFDPPSPAG
jgi:hypothetical protein